MSQPESSMSEIASIVRAMAARTPPIIASVTVSIVGSHSGNVRQIGTGTLLAVADAKFVVTAAHVLLKANEQELTVAISGGMGGTFTALTARDWIITADDQNNDQIDIALYQLDEREIDRLKTSEFIRIGDVCFDRDFSNAYFVVCGYPAMWSTTSHSADDEMKAKLLQYGTYAFKGSVSALAGFNPDRHILLDGAPENLLDENGDAARIRTRSGYPASFPQDLSGVSGSSIWRIGDTNIPISEWQANDARIVAVQTGIYTSNGTIKATRWNSVASLLHAAFPELRPSIEMYAHM